MFEGTERGDKVKQYLDTNHGFGDAEFSRPVLASMRRDKAKQCLDRNHGSAEEEESADDMPAMEAPQASRAQPRRISLATFMKNNLRASRPL